MELVLKSLDVVLTLLYAATTVLYLFNFLRDQDELRGASYALFGTVGLHAAYFVMRGFHFGFFPLGSRPEFLSLVALGILIAYAIVEGQQKQARTGVFFAGIAFVFQTIASVFMVYTDKHAILLENPMYAVHVIFLVFGVTSLAAGVLYAIMYILMERQLKSRDLGRFFRHLPPLMQIEKMSRVSTLAGTANLGLGLILGYLVGWTIPDFDFWSPKFVATDIIFVGYVVGLAWQRLRGMSGLVMSYGSLVWFAVFLVAVGGIDHAFMQL
jgi:ABC-type uncharacterized transport system permease subunit